MNLSGPATQAEQKAARPWVAGLALLLFIAGRCLVPMDETDLFYNLRLGEIIWRTHAVPRTNLLSFTYPDFPDPNLAWLFQLVLVLAHRAGGIAGTVLLKTAFVVATYGLLFRVALRRGAHPALAAAVLALSAWAAEPRFVERPHLVTFVGLATLLLALERAEQNRPVLLWLMLPLGVVWANGNSCCFLAPAVLLLYAAGAIADADNPAARAHARRAARVALAFVPLLFATPSGAGWMGYVANHFRMPYLRPLQEYRVAEWPLDAPFLFLLIAVAGVTIGPPRMPGCARPRLRSSLRHLLPVLALALLGSRRIRFVAEFALLAGPYVAAKATSLTCPWWGGRSSRLLAGGATSVIVAVSLVLLASLPRARARAAGAPLFSLGVEDGLVPEAAVRFMNRHGLRDQAYNDLEVGSYLTWEGWPRHRVFQDPRINGYPANIHEILRRSDLTRPEWEALLQRFSVTTALITYPDVNPRAALFDPEKWALCHRTPDALVFVRRGATAHAALVAATELPLTFRFAPASGVTPVPLIQPAAANSTAACEWQRRLAELYESLGRAAEAEIAYRAALAEGAGCLPADLRDDARERAAASALRFGDPARAAALLAGMNSPAARTNRAFAWLQLGRADQAIATFDQILHENPATPEAAFGRALALTKTKNASEQAAAALQAFIDRWPKHFAAAQARASLRALAPPRLPGSTGP